MGKRIYWPNVILVVILVALLSVIYSFAGNNVVVSQTIPSLTPPTPTATNIDVTVTLPPTPTSTRTATATTTTTTTATATEPSTATATATEAPIATTTATPVLPTETPVDTPEPPTETPATTPVLPTETPVGIPVLPTETSAATPVLPTETPATTPVLPTETPVGTPVLPTETSADAPVLPTETPVDTSEPINPVTNTLLDALLVESEKQTVIRFDPDSILFKEIVKANLAPNSLEFEVEFNGVSYLGQRAESLTDNTRKIYYVEVGGSEVKSVDFSTNNNPLGRFLIAEGEEQQVIYFNPDATLLRRIGRNGFIPSSSEFHFQFDNVMYIAQYAEDFDTGIVRVYFVSEGLWNNVQFIDRTP